METTLNDLRWKEVIGVTDGTRYGYVGDVTIDLTTGKIGALIVPGPARFFGLFGRGEDRVVRWEDVRRFGEDIILVEGIPSPRPAVRQRRKLF